MVRKLDRLVFPELTFGNGETEQERLARLTNLQLIEEMTRWRWDHKRLARLLAKMQAALCEKGFDFEEVRKLGGAFNDEFEGIVKQSGAVLRIAKVYDFLRRNWDRVEACETGAAIIAMRGFPERDYDRQHLYRLFRELGLPTAK